MTFVLQVAEDGLDLPLQLLLGSLAQRALPPPQPQRGEQVEPPARRQRRSVVLGDLGSVPPSLERDLLQEGGQVSPCAPGVGVPGVGEPAGTPLLAARLRSSEAQEGAEGEDSLGRWPRPAVAVGLRPPGGTESSGGKVTGFRRFMWSPTPFKHFTLETDKLLPGEHVPSVKLNQAH